MTEDPAEAAIRKATEKAKADEAAAAERAEEIKREIGQ